MTHHGLFAAALLCATASTAFAQTFEQAPGTKIKIDLAAMPVPYSPPSPANPPRTITRPAGAMPKAMEGYNVNLFAENLADARNLITAPNGDVFLAASGEGKIMVLRDADKFAETLLKLSPV